MINDDAIDDVMDIYQASSTLYHQLIGNALSQLPVSKFVNIDGAVSKTLLTAIVMSKFDIGTVNVDELVETLLDRVLIS